MDFLADWMRSSTSIIDLALFCRGSRTSLSDISVSPSSTIEDCPGDGGVASPGVTICCSSLPSLALSTWVVEDPESSKDADETFDKLEMVEDPELLGKDADETFDNVEDECDDCDLITPSLDAESTSELLDGEVSMLIDDCASGPDGGEWGMVVDMVLQVQY